MGFPVPKCPPLLTSLGGDCSMTWKYEVECDLDGTSSPRYSRGVVINIQQAFGPPRHL